MPNPPTAHGFEPKLLIAGLLWAAVVVGGMCALLEYASAGGTSAPAPRAWPDGTRLARSESQFSVYMFVHPRCPCSRASLAELDRLLSRCSAKLSATVVFVQPTNLPEGESILRSLASRLPNTRIVTDANGLEAERFGAQTSGYTMLFRPDGSLVFAGGLTTARGHEGASAGRLAVESLVLGPAQEANESISTVASSTVYGCPLRDLNTTCQQNGSACCPN